MVFPEVKVLMCTKKKINYASNILFVDVSVFDNNGWITLIIVLWLKLADYKTAVIPTQM